MIFKGFMYRTGIALREYGERHHKPWIVRLAVRVFFKGLY